MMCSVSLALFKNGWNPGSGAGDFISWSMLKIRQKVVVNPDGTGDYTSITDAIAAAPDNSLEDEGYYQIYVVAGVYNEYVSVAANKRYLMMVGDGIDKTIITGNRNVPDGWTTFNSATFGKFVPFPVVREYFRLFSVYIILKILQRRKIDP